MLLRRINVRSLRTSGTKSTFGQHVSRVLSRNISHVNRLPSWDLNAFQDQAFNIQQPSTLPRIKSSLPAACSKWFIHDNDDAQPVDIENLPTSSELRSSFWSEYESTLVPLELTTSSNNDANTSNSTSTPTFMRTEAPLKILLTYLSNPQQQTPFHSQSPGTPSPIQSIYLAQHSLSSLPPPLQSDLPTPTLVTSSGKGDIYGSSLWLGRPPTYTPLHRDPNPNLLQQLAGQKLIRLLPPDIGEHIFEELQARLDGSAVSSRFRGEEMMMGRERQALHELIWGDGEPTETGEAQSVPIDDLREAAGVYLSEARLGLGEALFIPKGWWHSVKGVGEGVTASANWWFR